MDYLRFLSQSPQIGSLFQSAEVADEERISVNLSQSPQIGSLFQCWEGLKSLAAQYSLNPLKSGHCFN